MMTQDEPLGRELTTLEYVVMGLISREPQSGYSIISYLETGTQRWSASPGSIYPMLKRLENGGFIVGELELVHETRPRKMYTLTDVGYKHLDAWIRADLNAAELYEERDITMLKFVFAEQRLSRAETIDWLQRYLEGTKAYDVARQFFFDLTRDEASVHFALVLESVMMELDMQRDWIQMAIQRLQQESE